MLYDINVRPEQIQKLAAWAQVGPDMADVELVVDDSMLLAEQGDERMAWDTDGSEGSEEYLSKAPLDPSPQNALVIELAGMLWPESFPPGHPAHDPDHVWWDGVDMDDPAAVAEHRSTAGPFQWSADTIEWVATEVRKRMPADWTVTP